MRLTLIFVWLAVLSCNSFYNSDKFDKSIWLYHNDITDTRNPRANMAEDLFKNYLRPGMHRDSVLTLLGAPYKETIETRLPRGLEVPDSLSLVDSINLSDQNWDKSLSKFNQWHKENGQPDTLMFYPIGWSTIDPRFVVVKFKADSTVGEFWIEQG